MICHDFLLNCIYLYLIVFYFMFIIPKFNIIFCSKTKNEVNLSFSVKVELTLI